MLYNKRKRTSYSRRNVYHFLFLSIRLIIISKVNYFQSILKSISKVNNFLTALLTKSVLSIFRTLIVYFNILFFKGRWGIFCLGLYARDCSLYVTLVWIIFDMIQSIYQLLPISTCYPNQMLFHHRMMMMITMTKRHRLLQQKWMQRLIYGSYW